MAVFNQSALDKLRVSTNASKHSIDNLAVRKKEREMQTLIQKAGVAQLKMTHRMDQFSSFGH